MAFTPVELSKDGVTTVATTAEELAQLQWEGWQLTGEEPSPDPTRLVTYAELETALAAERLGAAATAVTAIEAEPDVHTVGSWDFAQQPTVAGEPLEVAATVPDATATTKGAVALAGMLRGSASEPEVRPALDTETGVIRIATQAEVDAGEELSAVVVPARLKTFLDASYSPGGGGPTITDHGDGTFSISGDAVSDNGNGTFTVTG